MSSLASDNVVSGAIQLVRGAPSTMGDDFPLNTTTLMRHGARTNPEREIVYRTPGGGWDRYSYLDAFKRMGRLANALRSLGVQPGDRVGILDWNSRRHFELYYAIPGIAAVMLQMNLRLAPADLAYVVKHSQASLIAVDETLLPVAEALASQAPGVRGWIVMSDKPLSEITTSLAPIYHYEEMLAQADEEIEWPFIEETSAYSACYTTGTTGRPKGVYYSHRAIYLHSLSLASNIGMSIDDCTMIITPMFHGQGWGLPQAAVLMANKIVLPGRYVAEDTAPLTEAIIREGVTVANGAPAIFGPMLEHIRARETKPDLSRLRLMSGATEPPLSLMKGFYDLTGAEVIHAYGATETTPLVTLNRLKPSLRDLLDEDQRWDMKRKQGLPVTGVEVIIVDAEGRKVPKGSSAIGEVCMRGPWVSTSYHDMPDSADRFLNGYWRSGDVGAIDEFGYLKLTDRLKDVIKSGGEWISSIDMENLLVAHPLIREAAVVGVPHPQWQERPVAFVVLEPGAALDADEVRRHLSGAFAKWQLPETVIFTDAIPKTSVGKIDKKVLRAENRDLYKLTQKD